MDSLFWIRAGRIAGRPGPNAVPWELPRLREAGIGAVLSVNDGQACDPDAFARADIDYACVPFSRNAPPVDGDEDTCAAALPRALAFARAAIARDRAVLVHCTFGKDRTGMFLAYYLMREEGIDRRQAMAEVRERRPIAFSAHGWWELAERVLDRCADVPIGDSRRG